MKINIHKLYRAPAITQNFNASEYEQNHGLGNIKTIQLIKYPRTLEVLWTEYDFRVYCNKAANYFTVCEKRGG